MISRRKLHLLHMRDAVLELQSAAGDDLSVLRNRRYVERCLEILGEAARRIDRPYQENHPEIPWANIIGTRNVIAHDYEKISARLLKEILHQHLEDLLPSIEALIVLETEQGTL